MEHIKLKIEELIKTKPSNVLSISYGYKSINGKQTDELCIIYEVDKKKPISKVSALDFIPSTIIIDEEILKTDVNEIGEIKLAACNPACGQVNGPSSAVNKNFTRPLKGGLSYYAGGYNTTNESGGTLSFIAVNDNDCLVGVSCLHSLMNVNSAFITSDQDTTIGFNTNALQYAYTVLQGEVIWPPANPLSNIGKVMRYVPWLLPPALNQVDVAYISLNQNDIDMTNPSTSVMQAGDPYTAALPFATTAEINNLLVSNPDIYSSGGATGPKGGPTCPLRVFSLLTSFTQTTLNQFTWTSLLYSDWFQVCKPVIDPVLTPYCGVAIADLNAWAKGDSGSAVIADFGGVRKIIGVMGAFNSVGLAYCMRIDNIASQLNITAWDGTPKGFIDLTSVEHRTIPGGQPNKIETCSDGNDYWQVGLSDLYAYPEEPC
jgi:hypothetical protein